MPKFVTNKISSTKVDFDSFIKKLASANDQSSMTKTASTKKQAEMPDFIKEKIEAREGKKDEGEKKEEKEACAASASEKPVKVAEEKKEKDGEMHVKMQEMDPVGGTNTGKPEGEKKESKSSAPVKKVAEEKEVQTKGNETSVPANGGVKHQPDPCCGAPTSKGSDGSEGEKKSEKKESASKDNFVRIANLTSKQKSWLKAYWSMLYPSEYADAMVADR